MRRVNRLVIGEIDVSVLCEARMKSDVHVPMHSSRQAGLTRHIPLGASRNRLRFELAIPDNAQAARALRHELSSIRKERDAPGILEGIGDNDHADLLSFACIESHRLGRQWLA